MLYMTAFCYGEVLSEPIQNENDCKILSESAASELFVITNSDRQKNQGVVNLPQIQRCDDFATPFWYTVKQCVPCFRVDPFRTAPNLAVINSVLCRC